MAWIRRCYSDWHPKTVLCGYLLILKQHKALLWVTKVQLTPFRLCVIFACDIEAILAIDGVLSPIDVICLGIGPAHTLLVANWAEGVVKYLTLYYVANISFFLTLFRLLS